MDGVTLRLPETELAKLSQAMRAVAGATQRSAEEVARGFAGRILKRWAGRTPIVTEAKVDMRSRVRANSIAGTGRAGDVTFGVTINSGRRGGETGRVWTKRSPMGQSGQSYRLAGRILDDRFFNPEWVHYRAADWAEITDRVSTYLKYVEQMKIAGRKAMGLARQSIVQMADAVGIDLGAVPGSGLSAAGVAKARRAISSTGPHINGTGHALNAGGKFVLTLINQYPRNTKMRMDATLAGVIAGEIKYYEKNLEHAVFKSQAQTARAYPFLKVAA